MKKVVVRERREDETGHYWHVNKTYYVEEEDEKEKEKT